MWCIFKMAATHYRTSFHFLLNLQNVNFLCHWQVTPYFVSQTAIISRFDLVEREMSNCALRLFFVPLAYHRDITPFKVYFYIPQIYLKYHLRYKFIYTNKI